MSAAALPSSIRGVQAALEQALHCPGNVGIIMSRLHLPADPATPVLVLYIKGLADEDRLQERAIGLLADLRLNAENDLQFPVTAGAWVQLHSDLAAVIGRVVHGDTALFIEGAGAAVVVETRRLPAYPAGAAHVYPPKDIFSRDLIGNLALLRARLRDPNLMAEPLHRRDDQSAQTVLAYLHGRVDPDVLDQTRTWTRQYGEEQIRRGRLAGAAANFGLVPAMVGNRWPDKVAAALEAGYVAVLADQVYMVWLAPVTVPLLFYNPMDDTLARPFSVALRLARLLNLTFVLTAMGTVVALMNYHQEMMPTPFMLALAAVRENSPFPIIFEVLVVETLQELIREVGFHLPLRLSPGAGIVAGMLLFLILVLAGFISPLPATVSVAVAVSLLGISQYETIYFIRFWRVATLLGAGVLGFYGMAVVLFCLAAYLFQAESFGIPFIGETGARFATPGLVSSWRERRRQRGQVSHLR